MYTSVSKVIARRQTSGEPVGALIVWLRTEGSYRERRFAEIEALIANEIPQYYTSGDLVDFNRNPLYERLTAIQQSLEHLRRDARVIG